MIYAQRIALKNSAWVSLTFAARSGVCVTPSSTLLIGQSAVVDLAAFPFPAGQVFLPDVEVDLDARQNPPPPPEPVELTMNGRTAHYDVQGTIWTWHVDAGALDPPSGRPVVDGFPDTVPLNQLPFCNWDHQISLPAVLTCAPQTAQDLAAVCNWAAEHGYLVRPRGVMHGWSPFTLPVEPDSDARVLLVDLTKSLCETEYLPAGDGLPDRVRAGTGVTMLQLLTFLEGQPGGRGSAPGFSFPHTPAPGNLTLGGVIAIGAHGTAVPTPPGDAFKASYGSMSNQVLDLTVVCTDPANPTAGYGVRTFRRGTDADTEALLTALGRALIVEATLQVVDNYNLRCQSITDMPAATIFAAPTDSDPVPAGSFADFLNRMGRVEIIWFPFSDNPWLHVWQVAPDRPAESIAVQSPYNYPFADVVPEGLQRLISALVDGDPALTPLVGRMAATVTANGLDGRNWAGVAGEYPVSRDIWGPSKNTLLYIQDTTLRVTANGYAVHLRRTDVQQAVHDMTTQFSTMLAAYAGRGSYPVNSALEIRVTALDDPADVGVADAGSPVISALSIDGEDRSNGWDVAVWFDVLTIPGTEGSNEFYRELEQWMVSRFAGAAGRVMPEWSKGWAYTDADGPWSDETFLAATRAAFTRGRDSGHDWDDEVVTLQKYDAAGLFTNAFLRQLFQPSHAPAV
jgi:hypothetical protein